MKLISMTDFVLEQTNKITNEWSEDDQIRLLDKISNYANFLKRPLKLEMFLNDELFINVSVDTYNRIYCGGYVGEIIKDKLFSQKKTIEDLVNNNIQLSKNTIKRIFV